MSTTTRATEPQDHGATWITDPATTEDGIARRGIRGWTHLAAAMTRTPKGPVLLSALVKALTYETANGPTYTEPDACRIMDQLLSEPDLGAKHLAALAGVRMLAGAQFVTDLVTHPNTSPETVVDTLWGRHASFAKPCVEAGAGALPLAVVWAQRHHASGEYHSCLRRRRIRNEIYATATRWNTWADGQPGKIDFLASHWHDFRDEADPDAETNLLAAGDALFAAPG